ncbi:hypothetical protein [Streptomyces sp. NPDC021622]|uniref:hypothetical protein n=1 Tax=Streptomyces sp. NPDC021622 TaxID=3155013 RepID=UPI0034065DC7
MRLTDFGNEVIEAAKPLADRLGPVERTDAAERGARTGDRGWPLGDMGSPSP